jgi:hypothetical protein
MEPVKMCIILWNCKLNQNVHFWSCFINQTQIFFWITCHFLETAKWYSQRNHRAYVLLLFLCKRLLDKTQLHMGLLVEIGPEGWTPTQQPPEFSPFLRSLSRGSYFYLGEERERWNLIRLNRKQRNTPQTEDRRTGKCLRCSLLITVCPFHYKGFTIYRRPLGIVICLNYNFSAPDNPL